MADGPLMRFFWRSLDALHYWMMQARLSVVDALYGPNRRPRPIASEGVIGRISRASPALIERRGSPAALTP
jgi:hypothetical protein